MGVGVKTCLDSLQCKVTVCWDVSPVHHGARLKESEVSPSPLRPNSILFAFGIPLNPLASCVFTAS